MIKVAMMKLPYLIPVQQRVRRGWKRMCSKIWAFPFGACFVKRRCGRVSETRYAPLSASEVLALLSVFAVQGRNLGGTAACFGISSQYLGGVLFFFAPTQSRSQTNRGRSPTILYMKGTFP